MKFFKYRKVLRSEACVSPSICQQYVILKQGNQKTPGGKLYSVERLWKLHLQVQGK